MKYRLDRTRRARVVSTRENRGLSKWKKVMDDFFHGQHRSDVLTESPLLPDLSSEVTVFVSTVGAASFPDCMTHLAAQDCRFGLEVIEGLAPMSAAFQRMLDRCSTPFYVQVDEDMILRPSAVRRLHQRMQDSADDVALIVGWLWDVHLGRAIQGVKIFRHSIASRYPYADVESCEKDQLSRMQSDGFRYLRPEGIVTTANDDAVHGLHGAHYDPRSVFERYSTLERKRLAHPDKLAWFAEHAPDFIRRFQADPTELNLMALMGLIAGRLSAGTAAGEKDYTRYDALPGFNAAGAFMEACRGPVGREPGGAGAGNG